MIGTILILFLVLFATASGLDLRECNRPLGMTSRIIRDDQITSSSSFDLESTGPQNARLRIHQGAGAWCPAHQINSTTNEWIQITFTSDMVLSAVETEGRYDEGRGMEYPTAYRIQYWRSSISGWAVYKDDFGNEVILGNNDTTSTVLRILDGAIIARRVRIQPVSNSTRTVCLRFELYGCQYKDHLRSYSIPEGSSADGLSPHDYSYDGAMNSGIHSGGFGKLFDGKLGGDNFEAYPQKWVGWRKSKNDDYVTLSFRFEDPQNVSGILLHSANQFRYHAAAFSTAIVAFSLDGSSFSHRELHFRNPTDHKFETARWIRIQIPNRIATVVEIRLFFDPTSSWLLLSEVNFETNEVKFVPTAEGDDVSYHHIAEAVPAGSRISIILQFVAFGVCATSTVCCVLMFFRRRNRVKSSSPPPGYDVETSEVRICMNDGLKRVTPSTYQMARENEKNMKLELKPIDSTSDYAEPDISGDASLIPLLSSFHNTGCDYSIYSSSNPGTLTRNPLSSEAKYSEYGEVYATTLPEFERTKLQYLEKIGQGEFGEVNLCRLDNRKVAVKKLHGTSPEEEFAFQREIRVLGTLKHPNVVEVIGVSTSERPILCIMEYMENGDLKSYLSKQKEHSTPLCISICTQLAAGLAYLESCGFVHRDIAARNCLVDSEGNVKIADFGMARSLYSNEYYKMEGKFMLPIRWMAPETLLMGRFSTASDVWAFAITMWEIFTGCTQKPFPHMTDEQVLQEIQMVNRQVPLRPTLCPPYIYHDVMLPSWNDEPIRRPTFHGIHRHLQTLVHSQIGD